MESGSDDHPARATARAPRELLSLATELVSSGALPRADSTRVLAGPGQQRPCSLCSDLIKTAEVEYELSTNAGNSFRFHIPCYRAWQQAGTSPGSGGDHR